MKLEIGLVVSVFWILSSSLPALAEDVFFKLDNGKVYFIDDNTLAASMDEKGELAVKFKRRGTLNVGSGKENDPIYLGVSGRYFGRYVLTLLKTGEVEFPNYADAENTLRLCQQLGLPQVEEYIENYIRTRSLQTSEDHGFNALSLMLSQKKETKLLDIAQLVINATRANDVKTLRKIYQAELIDIDFLIPSKTGEVEEESLNGRIGSPAISYAAQAGNLEAVQLLLLLGANFKMRSIYPGGNTDGFTVLDWAKESKNEKVIYTIRKTIRDSQNESRCTVQ